MLHDVGEILARYRFDAKAALADGADESPRREARQRLAQRRRTDAVARRRLDNAEAAVGCERTLQDVRLDSFGGALGQGFRVAGRQGRTSLLMSISDCSMPCCFIVSIHHSKSAPFSSGWDREGWLSRTRSIGILVNLAIAWLAFSRSPLTIGAASAIDSRNALMASGCCSAKERVAT